jgi:hypothetical protein
VCAPPAAARKPSAEWNGFSLFAFPAMNRWAFFYRPARRDGASSWSKHRPAPCRKVKRPRQAKEACLGHRATHFKIDSWIEGAGWATRRTVSCR